MPELPEVETIARRLQKSIVGHTVTQAHVHSKLVVKEPPGSQFAQKIVGARISRVWRRAKWLVIDTDRGAIVVHLRMTGTLDALPAPDASIKFVRLALDLDD